MTFLSDLEREIALLVWHLRMRRMTPIESATHHNGLVGRTPRGGLECRVEDLIAELKQW
jgi:hypothetical protein